VYLPTRVVKRGGTFVLFILYTIYSNVSSARSSYYYCIDKIQKLQHLPVVFVWIEHTSKIHYTVNKFPKKKTKKFRLNTRTKHNSRAKTTTQQPVPHIYWYPDGQRSLTNRFRRRRCATATFSSRRARRASWVVVFVGLGAHHLLPTEPRNQPVRLRAQSRSFSLSRVRTHIWVPTQRNKKICFIPYAG